MTNKININKRSKEVSGYLKNISEVYNHIGAMALIAAWRLEEQLKTSISQRVITGTAIVAIAIGLIEPAEAITVASLKAPMQDLKKEMFEGWMWGAKAIAGVVGAGFAMAKQSLAPFGIGIGTAAGIHFWDKYIGDGSGALI